jgi:tetratricopeptide (TPR) repeat protein
LSRHVASSLQHLGINAVEGGDYASAQDYHSQAHAIYREIGDRHGEGTTLNALGILADGSQDYAQAQKYYESALAAAREVGARFGEAALSTNLGYQAFRRGDFREAQSFNQQGLAICREIESRSGEATILCNMGLVALAQADHVGAVASCEQALTVAREIGERWLEGYALTWLGDSSARLGQLDDAVEYLQQALYLRQELEQEQLIVESRACLARVRLARGELVEAQREVDHILAHLDSGKGLEGTDAPFLIHLTCILVLQTTKDTRAGEVLERAHRFLQELATRFPDNATRRSVLERVPWHHDIESAWAEQRGQS